MIKNKVSIERQINERQYQFIVPFEASLSEVLLIVDDIRKYVMDRISEAEKQSEQENKNNSQEKQV